MLNCYGYEKENPPVAAAQNAFTTTTSTMNVNKSTEVQNGQFLKLAVATRSFLNNADINRIKEQHTKSFVISTILLISVTILASPLISLVQAPLRIVILRPVYRLCKSSV